MVVSNLYCPECSTGVTIEVECMIFDNNWIMEFDLALAHSYLQRVNVNTECFNPEFLFMAMRPGMVSLQMISTTG